MVQAVSVPGEASNELELELEDGVTFVDYMGCGVFVVDQVDSFTQAAQQVVLTRADLERMLAWKG
ncbi:MAG TPA: hypothetical protein VF592_12030 [Sphingomonas sp.]|jgi:hypothetical protein|uniref:hypothetical protein n=1 Tax=Sphingomonas sp. TaxID=28214 RepID=UPI002EDA6FC1